MPNFTRLATPGGSKNERLAMFFGEGRPRVSATRTK
ncbi:hypothetical protein CA51_38610 [Rosistilla oblonga]|nr:hypothetical protein CA51_38610 [Rosistilla oblonga]